VAGPRRLIGQLGWCEAFRPGEERGCSGPTWAKTLGGPWTLENQPGRKNEKEKKIKDGVQGTFWAEWKLGRGERKEKKKANATVGPNWFSGQKGFVLKTKKEEMGCEIWLFWIWTQGIRFKSKRFKYFQTEFELDPK
jgi:hypothetical protein